MTFPLDLATFRARFPEAPTEDTFVQARLDEAELEIDATVWGAKAETGHGYLTAHKLGMTPYGRDARIEKPDGEITTTYGELFEQLAMRVGGAYRVVLP